PCARANLPKQRYLNKISLTPYFFSALLPILISDLCPRELIMSITAPPGPAPRTPSLSTPSERDFAIYQAVHIAGASTRSQADLYEISQTRVRQIVRRVVDWLGQVLPPQTNVAKENETYLARQIAADRFQFQLEEATRCWNQTNET